MRLGPVGVPLLNLRRRASRARGPLAAASGLALLLAAGCSSSASPGGAVSNTITIAAEPGVADAPLYLAQKKGLFAAEGLAHVVIKSYSSQQAELSALQTAQADIAASDYGNVFVQQAQNHDLRILADGYDATQGVLEILTLPGSPITSPADLVTKGVKIGIPDDDVLSGPEVAGSGPPSLDASAAADVIRTYVGIAQAGSLKWKPMPQQQEVNELRNGTLQAILVSEPYIYQAESKLGAVEVLDAGSGATAGLPLLGYVAMNAWVRENPAAVADFQAAIAKAQSDASLAGQVEGVLPGATRTTIHMSAQEADLITVGSYPTTTSGESLNQVTTLLTGDDPVMKDVKFGVSAMLVGSKG